MPGSAPPAVCWRLRTRHGLPVHDIAPMRVARRDALLALGVTDRRSGYPLELLVRAAAGGLAGGRASTSPTARAPAANRRSAARCAGSFIAALDFWKAIS